MATIKTCRKGHHLTPDNSFKRWDSAGGKYYDRCLKCRTDSKRDRTYGDGAAAWYEEKLIEQNGLCLICGEYFGRSLCLDHDHNTGKWRGLLCKFCNNLTGWVENDPDRIEKIMNYLKGDD